MWGCYVEVHIEIKMHCWLMLNGAFWLNWKLASWNDDLEKWRPIGFRVWKEHTIQHMFVVGIGL